MNTQIQQLITITDPITKRPLADRVQQHEGGIVIDCPYPVHPEFGTHHGTLLKALTDAGVDTDGITFRNRIQPAKTTSDPAPLSGIANVIAVGSGKGGVGKSTVSAGIALALHRLGARVGILDGDIYGPNQDILLGTRDQRLTVNTEKEFVPFDLDGMAMMTFAGVTGRDVPVVWRGPMIANALQQMLTQTQWPQLDYLIVDLPPGTGDIQLTLFQKVAVSGFVLVTTPQTMALAESAKTLGMIDKLNLPCLGLVENMNRFICSNCNQQHTIFGDGVAEFTNSHKLNTLGSIPIDVGLHDAQGRLQFDANPQVAEECIHIVEAMTASLANQIISQQGAVITSG